MFIDMVRYYPKPEEYIRRLEESNKDLRKEIERLKWNKDTAIFFGVIEKNWETYIPLRAWEQIRNRCNDLIKENELLKLKLDKIRDILKTMKEIF